MGRGPPSRRTPPRRARPPPSSVPLPVAWFLDARGAVAVRGGCSAPPSDACWGRRPAAGGGGAGVGRLVGDCHLSVVCDVNWLWLRLGCGGSWPTGGIGAGRPAGDGRVGSGGGEGPGCSGPAAG